MEGDGEPVLLLHGFPDSNYLWRDVIPEFARAGYRVIAPDLRGFGQSDAPVGRNNYDLNILAKDVTGLLDALDIDRIKLVGHDWGAMLGWYLAGTYPDRFKSYTAVSVGHLNAYASAGFEQKKKGWYVVMFQFKWIAEKMLSAFNWWFFRKIMLNHPETDHWIKDLSRPGRLTAAINWYRANFSKLLFFKAPRVKIPVFGIWSTRDLALAEDQMINSEKFVDAPWAYERIENVGHWIPIENPKKLSALILNYFNENN